MYGQNTSKENKNEEINTYREQESRIKPATLIEGWVCSIKLSDKHNMHEDHNNHSAHKNHNYYNVLH